MKFARIIGRVTLSSQEPTYHGGRFLLALPSHPRDGVDFDGTLPAGDSLVIYDKLGASPGDLVGYSDGGEAAAPFPVDTPVDAYCAAIIDQIFYHPLHPAS